jgi:fatty-acyl-CoA synthase
VAALCTNSHVMLELHHAVPMLGAALVPLNTRLSAGEMAGLLAHSGTSALVATHEFADRARQLADRAGLPCFIAGGPDDSYEAWIADAAEASPGPVDERQMLSINYTSGTTGRPKGVMYHHRGAYLQATAMAYHARLGPGARYLWTLPMFHCDGWCFTWAVTAAGGTHVCLRAVKTAEIWRLLREEGITHFSAAPTVLTMIAEDPAAGVLDHEVRVQAGGAPPSAALLARMASMRFAVTHLYGLTGTYGPLAIDEWQPEWDRLDPEERARPGARQGTPNIIARPLRVLDGDGRDVPADGETTGEIAVSGNDVMLGCYRDEEATRQATRSGCFLTGDLAVMHPDGYVEIRDRSKDIIISGGENIASVEAEGVLDSHPRPGRAHLQQPGRDQERELFVVADERAGDQRENRDRPAPLHQPGARAAGAARGPGGAGQVRARPRGDRRRAGQHVHQQPADPVHGVLAVRGARPAADARLGRPGRRLRRAALRDGRGHPAAPGGRPAGAAGLRGEVLRQDRRRPHLADDLRGRGRGHGHRPGPGGRPRRRRGRADLRQRAAQRGQLDHLAERGLRQRHHRVRARGQVTGAALPGPDA